eukprot:8934485-Ditylum_brightwellii.AAC.1
MASLISLNLDCSIGPNSMLLSSLSYGRISSSLNVDILVTKSVAFHCNIMTYKFNFFWEEVAFLQLPRD